MSRSKRYKFWINVLVWLGITCIIFLVGYLLYVESVLDTFLIYEWICLIVLLLGYLMIMISINKKGDVLI